MPEQPFRGAPALRRLLLCASGLLFCLAGTLGHAEGSRAPSALAEALRETRLSSWQQLLRQSAGSDEQARLESVNRFINRSIVYTEDQQLWGSADYWATPLETLGQGRGDCEDIAIAKYFSLVRLGVPSAKLRLTFVKALQRQQAHMVLAYYASPSTDPLVLDNLIPDIRPASRRTDLSPIFSFNSAGLWQGTGNQSSKSNLSRWQDLLARARAEGFQ